jgi:aryl-alcohol dehydrogenase
VGSTFAVMGAGAVGLSAVMAARVAGTVTIIAVDVLPARLDLAAEPGATHTADGREQDAVEEIRRITGEGVDHALDTTGLPPLTGQMIQALRQRGTTAVLGAFYGFDQINMTAADAASGRAVKPVLRMAERVVSGDAAVCR